VNKPIFVITDLPPRWCVTSIHRGLAETAACQRHRPL
jgi:hypothetical protein